MDRQGKGKPGPPPCASTLHPDVASMGFYNMPSDGQAQAAAPSSPRARPVHPVEPFEDMRQVFSGDADARVADPV